MEQTMYNLYLFIFRLIYSIGLKKTSVRLARHMEKYARYPLESSKLYDAIWEFYLSQQSFNPCELQFGCYTPVLSDTDRFHEKCRLAQAEYEAQMAAEEQAAWDWYHAEQEAEHKRQAAEYEAEMARFHAEDEAQRAADQLWYDTRCSEIACNEEAEENGLCAMHQVDEEDDFDEPYDEYDPRDDDFDDEDICQGCGNTDIGCVCAELASYKAFQSNPETAGSWWTP